MFRAMVIATEPLPNRTRRQRVYTYFWSPVPPNGQGVPIATGLCAGEYVLIDGSERLFDSGHDHGQ